MQSQISAQAAANRPHPRGGALALIAALLALFPGSAALGTALAEWLAPGSWVAQIAGFFALPVAFAAGLQMWIGVAIFGAIVRLLVRRRSVSAATGRPSASLPGSFVFLPLSSGAGLLAGVIVGLVPAAESWLGAVAVFWLAGTLHGWVAWRLARSGVLVPPESM
jgi:hypothetical protein